MVAPVNAKTKKKYSTRKHVTEGRVRRISEVCGVTGHNWNNGRKALLARLVDRCRYPYGKAEHRLRKGASIIPKDEWRNFTRKQIEELKETVFVTSNVYNYKEGIAKDWKLRPRILAELSAMDRKYKPELTVLIDENTGVKVNRRNVINTRKEQDSLHNIPAICPVNLFALQHLHSALNHWIEFTDGVIDSRPNVLAEEIAQKESEYQDLSLNDRKVELSHWLGRARGEVVRIMELACTKQSEGALPQVFIESDAGRWFASDFNLQSCSKVVRKAALHGCYQYDIEACHHLILHKVATDARIKTPALSKYVSNRKVVREQLAAEVGVSVATIKEVLIAMIYGAKKSNWPRSAMFELLGNAQDKAFEIPALKQLQQEIRSAFRFLLDSGGGYEQVRNAKGKILLSSDFRSKNQEAAFHMQGFESLCLESALKVHTSAVLPMHDGWICTDEESAKVAEVAILEATGFPVKIEVEQYCLSGFEDIDTSQGSLLLAG